MSAPVLTAAEMRAAEQRAIDGGISVAMLMERAGAGAAEAILSFTGLGPTLVLCGPGNNGGDGYVIARILRERGAAVAVAALDDPRSEAAIAAREAWGGPVADLSRAEPSPLLVDALFGTGLSRGLDASACERLTVLSAAAETKVAIDLPSGVSTDDGALLSPVPDYDLTVTFGALKPAHLLQPAARHMGKIEVADIGIVAESDVSKIEKPRLRRPDPDDHKYKRGLVAIVGGAMPGAAALAALGAARSGAGYVRLFSTEDISGLPHAIVRKRYADRAGLAGHLADARIGAVVLGPGMGDPHDLFAAVLDCGHPLVLDADALALIDGRPFEVPAILTPHEGEFGRMFPELSGSKIERAREAARRLNAIVLLKGPDTVVAAPDGRAAISAPLPPALATAGTGDVLAGICGTMLAQLGNPFTAACAAVWLHGEAAQRLPAPFIADDLALTLPAAVGDCW